MVFRAFALAIFPLLAMAPAAACPYTVTDGDTMTVDATGEVIRLLGFDTPEIEHAWCEAEKRLGEKAKDALAAVVCAPGANIAIERGPKPDRYKRTLARVTAGGRDVAAIMISGGWARPYDGGRRKGWCSRDSRDDMVP